MTHVLLGREIWSGRPIRVRVESATIVAIVERTDALDCEDIWIAPALWDLQVNGGRGISFSDPGLTVEQVRAVCEDQRHAGVARFCPTLITASRDALLHGVRVIARACAEDARIARTVIGIHLEGPGISERDGYRGAHPTEHVRDLTWEEFSRLQEASGGRIVLVTLAPERVGAMDLIARLTGAGVAVALGHTAADTPTLRAAVDAGARLSTHLGNGIASPLPRHPNPIWCQAADDRLSASFIADDAHLDSDTLRVLARAKGGARTILVSDLSPLAGCVPGDYGDWRIRDDGRIVVAGTEYLAGAWTPLRACIGTLARAVDWPIADVLRCATTNPAGLLGREIPAIVEGQPANLLRLRCDVRGGAREIQFLDGVVGGEAVLWSGAAS